MLLCWLRDVVAYDGHHKFSRVPASDDILGASLQSIGIQPKCLWVLWRSKAREVQCSFKVLGRSWKHVLGVGETWTTEYFWFTYYHSGYSVLWYLLELDSELFKEALLVVLRIQDVSLSYRSCLGELTSSLALPISCLLHNASLQVMSSLFLVDVGEHISFTRKHFDAWNNLLLENPLVLAVENRENVQIFKYRLFRLRETDSVNMNFLKL